MLKGLSNLASLPGILKQAQEMSAKLQQAQTELAAKRVTGAAGGGLVEVDANGLGEVLAVRLDPNLVARQDREMLEDLLPAAINAAQAKAKQLHAESLSHITGGMSIPGLTDALGGMSDGSPQN